MLLKFIPDVLDASVVVGVAATSGHDHSGCQIDELIILYLKLNKIELKNIQVKCYKTCLNYYSKSFS